MVPWQSTFEKLSNIVPYLLQTGSLSDVTFHVGDGSNKRSFVAHKLLLAVRSDVFEKMFFGALPMKGEEIEIPDVSPAAFDIMLKFVYEDILEAKSMEEAIDTFAIAHKYNITQLIHLCRNYMKDQLNPENVSLVYEMSMIFDEEDLESVCSQMITDTPEEVIESETFTEISFEAVENIVGIRSFHVSNQFILFESLMKWTKADLGRRQGDKSAKSARQLMNPLLPKINFLSMSSKEFTRGPAVSGIFNYSEIAKIFMNISIPDSAPLPEWCKKAENSKPRSVSSLSRLLFERSVLHECQNYSGLNFIEVQSSGKVVVPCEVSCDIKVTEKSIRVKGFSIFNNDGSVNSIIFTTDNIQQAVDFTIFNCGHVMITILKEPFLLKRNSGYHIKVNANTNLCCKGNVNKVDKPLPSSGRLLIRYYPSSSDTVKSLHFSELFYVECS